MPVDVSFIQVALLGALIAIAAALLLAVVIGLSIGFWFLRRAALFRSFGIERTESGSVQFKGLFNSQKERAEEASLMERVFGPGKFDSDPEPTADEPPN